MKRKTVRIILLLIILALALILSACSQPTTSSRNLGVAAVSMQVATPTPPVRDQSKIGSTNGIFIMGFVIVAITSAPFLLRRRKK
jgi:hypothetical protein